MTKEPLIDQEAHEAIQEARETLIERAHKAQEDPLASEIDFDVVTTVLQETPDGELLCLMSLFGPLYLEMLESSQQAIRVPVAKFARIRQKGRGKH